MVLDTIKGILVDQLGASADSITMESRLVEDLNADSIDKAEIVTSIEDAFDIIVDYDKALKIKTVGEIVTEVEKMIG